MGKKIVALITCLAIIFTILIYTPDTNAGIQMLNLSKQSKEIKVGESFQLTMTGVKASSIKWKSSKPGVATVNKKGVIKGVKVGTTNITGKYKSLKFTIKVIVKTTDTTTEKTPTSIIPSTGLYLGSCHNVDLYLTKIDDDYVYLKAINKNAFIVKVDFVYLNFDDTTLNNIVSFDVSADNFRIYNQIYRTGEIPKDFKTVTGQVKILDESWDTLDTADLTAYVK